MPSLLRSLFLVVFIATIALPVQAQRKLSVVTTLTDLAQLTKEIGGDRVKVVSIATGFQNPHFVDPKPSHILKLSRADMFVSTGLDLTNGWVPPLLTSSRNNKIQPGADGYVDTSVDVKLRNVPTNTGRDQGDIHIYGNPHYWLDPSLGHTIAQNIFNGLVRLQPQNEAYFQANLDQFNAELESRIAEWHAHIEPYLGTKIVAYHDQWPYFEAAFGLNIIEFLEPKPGIPPTPSQLTKVMESMKAQQVKVIIISPYYKADTAELVAREVGGTVITLAPSVGAFSEVKTYFDVFDYNLNLILTALSPTTN